MKSKAIITIEHDSETLDLNITLNFEPEIGQEDCHLPGKLAMHAVETIQEALGNRT